MEAYILSDMPRNLFEEKYTRKNEKKNLNFFKKKRKKREKKNVVALV